jgi:ElaB/YqjD/DUF883 family membrane-anchored ribosome-binding protein
MKENRNSGWKFWLGLAAGVAAGFYLNSEEGRRIRREATDRAGRLSRDLNDRARTEFGTLSVKAGDVLQRSKSVADRARTNLKQKIGQFSSVAEDVLDRTEESIEKVADWAVNKLHEGNPSTEPPKAVKEGKSHPKA